MKYVRDEINALLQKSDLLRYLISSNLKGNYKGTFFGFLWIVLDPLFLMLIYTILVSVIFQRGGPQFPALLFISIISWKWFVQSVSTSLKVYNSNQSLLQTLKLPLSIFPLNQMSLGFVVFIASFVPLILLLFLFDATINLNLLWLPVIIFLQAVFVLGASLVMSVAGAFFHDLQNIMTFVFRLWFYASPGLYQLSRVPEEYQTAYLIINPFASLMESYKNVLVYGKPPHAYLWLFSAIGVLLFFYGFYLVGKYRNRIVKVL